MMIEFIMPSEIDFKHSYHENLQIPKNDKNQYICGKNNIFSVLIISKILLPPEEFNTMFNKISDRLTSLSKN